MESDKKVKSHIKVDFETKEKSYFISKQKLEKISLLSVTDDEYEYVNTMANGIRKLFQTANTDDIEPLFSISDIYENMANVKSHQQIQDDAINLKNNSLYFNEESNTIDVPIVVK